jgi:hypothetical protein
MRMAHNDNMRFDCWSRKKGGGHYVCLLPMGAQCRRKAKRPLNELKTETKFKSVGHITFHQWLFEKGSWLWSWYLGFIEDANNGQHYRLTDLKPNIGWSSRIRHGCTDCVYCRLLLGKVALHMYEGALSAPSSPPCCWSLGLTCWTNTLLFRSSLTSIYVSHWCFHTNHQVLPFGYRTILVRRHNRYANAFQRGYVHT